MRPSIAKNSFSSTNDELKYKLILVGDSCVGKSSLFMKFMHGDQFDPFLPMVTTVDFNTKDVYLPEEKELVKLFIWDTAGQERYRSIVSTYFKGCHGVMLCFDLSEPKSFQNLKTQWYPVIKRKAESATILIVGNKCDLQQKVQQNEILKFCRQNNLGYIKSSVREDVNVREGFERLTRMVNSRRNLMEKSESFSIKRRGSGKEVKRGCCLGH